MSAVYITPAAKFLPNKAVSNEEMDGYLGLINGHPFRGKHLTLRNNGIKLRYYSVDKSGRSTHNKGQNVLLMVPESARFTYAYCLLTAC